MDTCSENMSDENTSMVFLTPTGHESNEQMSAAMSSATLVVDTPKSRRPRGKVHVAEKH